MRTLLAIPLFLLAACSAETPTSPTTSSPAPPVLFTGNLSGTWTGSYSISSCTPTAAPNTCTNYVPKAPGTMTLVLVQSGHQLSGTFSSDFLSTPFDVTGAVDDLGTVSLQGSRKDFWTCLGFIGDSMDVYSAVGNWRTQITKTDELLGAFTQSQRHSLSSCYFALFDFRSEVISLKRK